jgi:hypothetical protein
MDDGYYWARPRSGGDWRPVLVTNSKLPDVGAVVFNGDEGEPIAQWEIAHPVVPYDAAPLKSLDITGSGLVEISIRSDGKVIWINTTENGCVLRICQIHNLILNDMRKTRKKWK